MGYAITEESRMNQWNSGHGVNFGGDLLCGDES